MCKAQRRAAAVSDVPRGGTIFRAATLGDAQLCAAAVAKAQLRTATVDDA